MSVINVKSALQLGAGATVPAIAGVLRIVWPPKSGTSAKDGKAWTLQGGVIDDGDSSARFTIWNHEDVSSLKGQSVVFSSIKAGNGRLSGLQVKAGKDKEGNGILELHLDNPGIIQTSEGWAKDNPGATIPTATSPTLAKPDAPAPLPGSIRDTAPTPSPAAKSQPAFVRPTLDDLVALFGACFRAAKVVMWSGDVPPEGASLQAIASSAGNLFINSCNNGLAVGAARRD